MKHEAQVFEITSPTKENYRSLNYIIWISSLNSTIIFEMWNMHEPQKNVYDVHGPITYM